MDEEQKIVEMDREETGAERDGKTAQPQRREELVVKLKAPYRFEGKDYDEIDLNGLEKLTIQTAVDIQLELTYIKIENDGVTLVEVDKLNGVYIVNGEDALKDIRDLV